MSNDSNRAGMKQNDDKQDGAKKHQGVRPGSSATAKERHQAEPRKPVVPKSKNK